MASPSGSANGGVIGVSNKTSFGKCTVTSKTSTGTITTQPGTRLVETLVVGGGCGSCKRRGGRTRKRYNAGGYLRGPSHEQGGILASTNGEMVELEGGEYIINAQTVNALGTQFLDQLNTEQFEKVVNFFNTMPKLRHVVDVTNPKTKVKSEVLLEGLQSFLG